MKLTKVLLTSASLGSAEETCQQGDGQTCGGHQSENVLLQRIGKLQTSKIETDSNHTSSRQDTSDAYTYCRFATTKDWIGAGLLDNEAVQDDFVKAALTWDGKFVRDYSGMTSKANTRDHITMTDEGNIRSQAGYTAASKESLHMGMLALALDAGGADGTGLSKLAHHWLAPTQEEADVVAIDRLTKIITSYEEWNAKCTGCGGFIPWLSVNDDEGFILPGEKFKIPALDNGQMAWGMISIIEALRVAQSRLEAQGVDVVGLMSRFEDHVELMKLTAPQAFLDPKKGRVYSSVKPVSKDLAAGKTSPESSDFKKKKGKLADPFEGELMNFFIALFGDSSIVTKKVRGKQFKKIGKADISNTYTPTSSPAGSAPITLQEGWRFSAHEEWKYLVLPYGDVQNAMNLRESNERARTWYSVDNGIPGMKAACYDSDDIYIDRLGAEPLSYGYTEPPPEEEMVTPYGAFPLITIARGPGLSWYHSTLARPMMQSQFGSTESSAYLLDDAPVAKFVTWDTKVTTDVAMSGGTGHLTRAYMERMGTYDTFKDIVEGQHKKYVTVSGAEHGFAPAPAVFDASSHDGAMDFETCQIDVAA